MAETRYYDARKVTIVFDGVFITGLAEGTFVDCSRNEESFESEVGGQGEVDVSEINDPRGTITVTLRQTSPSLPFLQAAANQKRVAPLWVYSANSPREKTGGSEARLKKVADVSHGARAENRELEFEVFDYEAAAEA